MKKWGLYGVLAIATLYSPLFISIFKQDPSFTAFALWWSALWASPLTPGWLFILLLATFYKWLVSVVIFGFIKWSKENIIKIQIQNQLGLYYTSHEIKMFLEMGKEIKKYSDEEKKLFQEKLRICRIKKIDDQWSEETTTPKNP